MKLTNFAHELVCSFVTMDDIEKLNLKNDGAEEYIKILSQAKEIKNYNKMAEEENEANKGKADYKPVPLQPLKFKHKFVLACETVWARYLFASLFIVAKVWIKNLINGENRLNEDDHEDEQSDLEQFMEWKRFKNQQR